MAKFKKGDKVEIITIPSFPSMIGDLGTVCQDGYSTPYVNWERNSNNLTVYDGKGVSACHQDRMRLVESSPPDFRFATITSSDNDKKEVEKYDFKVGERVRVIKETHGWGLVKPGEIGTVRRIDGRTYFVAFKENSGWQGYGECFEPETNQLITKSKLMTKSLIGKFINRNLKDPQKTLRKLNITDDQDILTQEGRELYINFLMQKEDSTAPDSFFMTVAQPMLVESEADNKKSE